jgi:hypothetical protein
MPASLLLLRVATTWAVPGLGLLALPAGPTPNLRSYDLHTALAVVAIAPDGTRYEAAATVEEVTSDDAAGTTVRGLLLDFGSPVTLLPASEVWLAATGR